MKNRLTQQLAIDYPIIQAPMAGVSTPELAAAVSGAGALGSLGLGSSTVEQAEALINQTRRLTSRPFNVNLFCHAPAVRIGSVKPGGWLGCARNLPASPAIRRRHWRKSTSVLISSREWPSCCSILPRRR